MATAQQRKLRKKWIAALRSGKYKQGKGALLKNDKYCCLGVLCQIADPDETLGPWKDKYTLPQKIVDRVGLNHNNGRFNKDLKTPYFLGTKYSLVYYNDESRYSFKKIADIIEKEPEGLFK